MHGRSIRHWLGTFFINRPHIYFRCYQCISHKLKVIPYPVKICRGVHPHESMMHFPPVSDFAPYFEKIFRLRGKFPNVKVLFKSTL